MQSETITLSELEKLNGFTHVTIGYLAPFTESIEITIEYPEKYKKTYALELRPDDLGRFSEWAAKAVAG